MNHIALYICFSVTSYYELSEVLDLQCLETCFKQEHHSLANKIRNMPVGYSSLILTISKSLLESMRIFNCIPAQNLFLHKFSGGQQVTNFSHSCINSQ